MIWTYLLCLDIHAIYWWFSFIPYGAYQCGFGKAWQVVEIVKYLISMDNSIKWENKISWQKWKANLIEPWTLSVLTLNDQYMKDRLTTILVWNIMYNSVKFRGTRNKRHIWCVYSNSRHEPSPTKKNLSTKINYLLNYRSICQHSLAY